MRILFTILFLASFPFLTSAQRKSENQKVTYLNRHFYEISKNDEENRAYQQINNELKNGDIVYMIFDMENQMVVRGKLEINQKEQFRQETREFINQDNSVKSRTIKNLDNGRYSASFYQNDEKKGQVIYLGEQSYTLWRGSPEAEKMVDRDDFQPGLDLQKLQEIYIQNLQYPLSARRSGQSGTVQIALLISETGELKEIEPANAYGMNKELVKEALRVIQLYDGPFFPALDLQGNPVEAWMFVPVRFKLG